MVLNDIFPYFKIENIEYECKLKFDRENVISWLKTIDGFANGVGGTIFVGVENGTNKLIGFDSKQLDNEKLFFYHELKSHFDILPVITSTSLEYIVNDKKRYILRIDIAESKFKPLVLKYQQMPMIFIRRDGFTNAASTEEIIKMSLNNNSPKFDSSLSDIYFKIDDFTKLSEFFKERTNRNIKEKDLAAISFFDDRKILTNGALLFKDDYSGEKTKVVCSLYKGLSRGDDMIIASNTFNGNLIDCYYYIYEFINQRMNHGFIKTGISRIDIDSYPQRSLFEAIINALAHRDYLIDGSAIYVDLFVNRLVITSPGSLYMGNDINITYDFDSLISRRRNELICDVFVYCKAMEAKGTGLEKILADYKNADSRHKPYIFSKNNQFSIVLPDLLYEQGVDSSVESIIVEQKIENSSRYDFTILAFCYGKKCSSKSISDQLGLSDSSFFRKEILNNLVKQGFLVSSLEGKRFLYTTNLEKVYRK